MLTKEQLHELRVLSSDIGAVVGLVERANEEGRLGVLWRVPSPKPTPESAALALRRIAAEVARIAIEIETRNEEVAP